MVIISLRDSTASHDAFFSRIIDMIPSDLYKHSVSAENDEEVNTKYYKHRKLPLTVDEKKNISKRKVSEKYSELASANREKRFEAEKEADASAINSSDVTGISNDLNVLRERLQKRILGLKSDRTSAKPFKMLRAEQAARTKASSKAEPPGKKDSARNKNKKSSTTTGKRSRSELSDGVGDSGGASTVKSFSEDASHSSSDVQFSNLLMISKEESGSANQNKAPAPGSKMQRLKRLLDESEKKRTRLENLSREGEIGLKKVESEKWSDALKTAAGQKAIIVSSGGSNTDQKIRKAIKRREATKRKSADKWKERLDNTEAAKTSRIDKRESNIAKRKNGGVSVTTEVESSVDASSSGGVKKHRNNPHSEYFKKHNKVPDEGSSAPSSSGKKDSNRAGFEGKKKMGDFLNKQKGKK